MKRFWRNSIATMFAVLVSTGVLAEQAPPASVKIAIVAYTQGGKPVFGGIAGRVIEDGWLEAQLRERGVKLEWIALPHAGAGRRSTKASATTAWTSPYAVTCPR